jgi:hypothetical protein
VIQHAQKDLNLTRRDRPGAASDPQENVEGQAIQTVIRGNVACEAHHDLERNSRARASFHFLIHMAMAPNNGGDEL